ncbi:MAG: hypothetical protein AABX93_00715 [Nanoarchaeota archaeon]
MNLLKIKKEIARDIISLGGPVFFILALVRISITANYPYLSKIALAGILFLALMFWFKANLHSGLGIIILIFTSIYYNYVYFTIFAGAIYCTAIYSLFYLKKNKKEIIKGILFGLISIGISYYVVNLIF